MKRIVVLVGTLALAACGDGPPVVHADSPGMKNAVFQDVPIPQGLNYDEGYGHATPDGALRVYTQELSGKRRPEDVAKFYRETLALHGWTPGAEETKEPRHLTFTKKREECAVHIVSTTTGVKVTVKLDYKR